MFLPKISKIKNKILNNKINLLTTVIAIIQIIIFIIGYNHIKADYKIDEILSIAANYVAICSSIIVLIQLIAFVHDSRHKEFRCRKESALSLAKEYAEEILPRITYINNVLSLHYDKTNKDRLQGELLENELPEFTLETLSREFEPRGYASLIIYSQTIELDVLSEPLTLSKFIDLLDVKDKPLDEQEKIAYQRFRFLVSNTLNTLEYFAMSVNQNVAESEMLFISLHQTYLKFVYYTYPFICMSNFDDETYYTNIIELFNSWKEKQKNMELSKNKTKIKSKKIIDKTKKKLRKMKRSTPL